ncbi:ATPase AAA [Verrucomicrobiota bacterium]|nr:ATPase AAA [Verrucomicrobiota bacterium]
MSETESVPPLPPVPPVLSTAPPPITPVITPVSTAPVAPVAPAVPTDREVYENLVSSRARIRTELGKVIVGQHEVVEQLLLALFAGGHCLITGAPGLAKTLLVKSIAQIFHLKFQRIQFTPDLMPADITGTEILEATGDGRRMLFVPGPIFANMILADEINRTPPKTQAALLEAMQEHQVTAAGVRHALPEPFFVLATQNPIEMEGTYPLPEAQLDRFMFNVVIDYLPEDDEVAVVSQTTARRGEPIQPLFTGEDVLRFHDLVRKVPMAEDVVRYAVRLAAMSRPRQKTTPDFVNEWVNWGAGLRAAQFLVLGSKARALLQGRTHGTVQDVKALAHPVLRHRILVNYRAEAEGVNVEKVIDRLLATVPPPVPAEAANTKGKA